MNILLQILLALGWIVPRAQADSVTVRLPEFRYVRFANEASGWVMGFRGLYHSSDGGLSWHRLPVSGPRTREYSARTLLMEKFRPVWAGATGLVVWADAQVCQIAIAECTPMHLPVREISGLHSIAFCDRQTGWAVADDGVYQSADGGANWVRAGPGEPSLGPITPLSISEAWSAGRGGLLFHTLNGGRTWSRTSLPEASGGSLRQLSFAGPNDGWIVGSDGSHGLVYRTIDSGATWVALRVASTWGLRSVSFAGDEGWIVADGGPILHSVDAGEHWEMQMDHPKDEFLDVQALPGGSAWVVGRAGTVLRTANHGKTWESVSVE
jgi:photosystem II stability/assembly factor-like uncharacterized protein